MSFDNNYRSSNPYAAPIPDDAYEGYEPPDGLPDPQPDPDQPEASWVERIIQDGCGSFVAYRKNLRPRSMAPPATSRP